MSTQDCPGFGNAKNDTLEMGCWAEHEDGSLLLVQSTEGGRVVYMMFDVSTTPITEYRDAMPGETFKKTFSWGKTKEKWVWHNRTPFPFDKIIKMGAKDGVHFASVEDQLSAAERLAKSLKLRKQKFNPEEFDHLTEKVKQGPTSNRVIRAIQAAINELKI